MIIIGNPISKPNVIYFSHFIDFPSKTIGDKENTVWVYASSGWYHSVGAVHRNDSTQRAKKEVKTSYLPRKGVDLPTV